MTKEEFTKRRSEIDREKKEVWADVEEHRQEEKNFLKELDEKAHPKEEKKKENKKFFFCCGAAAAVLVIIAAVFKTKGATK